MVAAEQEYVEFIEATPSGIEVLYSPSPKRLYKLRQLKTDQDFETEGVEWVEVPSVTTVLSVLDKPALPWWGMKVGIEGVLALMEANVVTPLLRALNGHSAGSYLSHAGVWHEEGLSVDQVVELLKQHKLTVNHQRDKAGDRGVVVHDAFETWAKTGDLPEPVMYPDEQRGYVVGVQRFLFDVNPEPIAAEVMVGSLEHGYAGRYDVRFRVTKECNVVYHRTPRRGDHYAVLKPGLILGDLKTSSGVYPSHSLQLEAYELAGIECGHEPTDARGILHVTNDGGYEFVRSTATAEDWLAVLEAHRALERIKGRKR